MKRVGIIIGAILVIGLVVLAILGGTKVMHYDKIQKQINQTLEQSGRGDWQINKKDVSIDEKFMTVKLISADGKAKYKVMPYKPNVNTGSMHIWEFSSEKQAISYLTGEYPNFESQKAAKGDGTINFLDLTGEGKVLYYQKGKVVIAFGFVDATFDHEAFAISFLKG